MFFENLYNNCRSLYKVRMADFSCSLSLSIKIKKVDENIKKQDIKFKLSSNKIIK